MTPRASGVLLHPTSLPGPFGVGDLGDEVVRFLDWLAAAGQRWWQILPLGPTGLGNSPYTASSAFAGNPLLISPQRLVTDGLLERSVIEPAPGFEAGRVDYDEAGAWKQGVLRASWELFRNRPVGEAQEELDTFVEAPDRAFWLEDWCLFAALKKEQNGEPWHRWPRDIRMRDPRAMRRARQRLVAEIEFQRYLQFLFWRQWSAIKEAAAARNIRIFGDIPIYVAQDSAEVWSHTEFFELDDAGRPLKVAGVPPDYFSATGQRWGNPIYRWDRLREQGYRWWIERLRTNFEQVDLLRLDHFRGFAGYWEIDAEETTAVNGRWVDGPGMSLFEAVRSALGELPLVAEDLGVITKDVVELRKELALPGMKVLQFGFLELDSEHLPHNVSEDTIYYTGTHDNDTVVGWFGGLDESQIADALDYLGSRESAIHQEMIRAVLSSRARLTVIPAQDLLGLDSRSRMNTPGVADGNWQWRLTEGQLAEPLSAWLARLCLLTGRISEALGLSESARD